MAEEVVVAELDSVAVLVRLTDTDALAVGVVDTLVLLLSVNESE